MSTLVTGGTGFIGRHVARSPAERRDRVVSYDRGPRGRRLPARRRRVRGELFDLRRLAATIAGHDVRGIVHAAGMADPLLSIGMPAATVAANANGTLAPARGRAASPVSAAESSCSRRRAVYGDNEDAVDERSPLRPRTPYAATKAFGDLLGHVYGRSYGLDVVSLRLSEAYGPGRGCRARAGRSSTPRPTAARCGWTSAPTTRSSRSTSRMSRARRHRRAAAPVRSRPHLRHHRRRAGPARARGRPGARPVPGADIQLGPGPLAGRPPGPVAITAADRELGYRPRWGLARGIDDYCAWREAQEAC